MLETMKVVRCFNCPLLQYSSTEEIHFCGISVLIDVDIRGSEIPKACPLREKDILITLEARSETNG